MCSYVIVFFKRETAYEVRISDWSSDVCSSDLTLLGSPSTSSTFPDWGTTYYYISSETEAVAFLAPEVIEQQVLAIAFDKSTSKVKDIKRYGLKDGKQIAFVDRETPTRGKELTVLEQLFGNFGRFNNDTNKK